MEIPTKSGNETWESSWRDWFKRPDSQGARSLLKPLDQWKAPTVPKYATPELCRITNSSTSVTEAELRKQLELVTISQLRDYVTNQCSELKVESESWEAKRRTGWRKATTGIQEIVTASDTFLAGFSGIVEIVRMADNQFGGAATTVLAVFFATIKLKASNDSSIYSSMRMISNQLPDLDIYYKVYADDQLARLICQAYIEVLMFARKATEYFQDHGISRLGKVFSQSGKFQGSEENMGRNFREIHLRCDALMAQQISHLSTQNHELIRQVEDLQKEIEGLNNRGDLRAAKEVGELLGSDNTIPRPVRLEKLAQFRRFLETIFRDYRSYLTRMTLEDLKRYPKFGVWQNAPSSMLVLHGNNHASCTVEQSWLSPAALQFEMETRDSKPGSVVAICNCKPGMSADSVLKRIIYQLVEEQPRVLRMSRVGEDMDITHRLRAVGLGQEPARGSDDEYEKTPLDEYCQVMRTILERYWEIRVGNQASVHLILDRPDVLKKGDTWALIKALILLLGGRATGLKILVVLKTNRWDIEDRLHSVDKEIRSSQKFLIIRQDQEEND